jgi:hypothetical protein
MVRRRYSKNNTGDPMSFIKQQSTRRLAAGLMVAAASLSVFGITGCQRKEKVVDIKAPGVDVEVERNVDTGEVEVDANKR